MVFSGERLPGGKKLEAIYIILNELFLEYLRHAQTRPLDYNYLCDLPPAPRRFYELISPEIYGAIVKNQKSQTASYLYSELCTFAPFARSFDWDVVRKQMTRLHKSHTDSGYLSKVDFERTEDKDGNPDWLFLYTPGRKAFHEFREFAPKKGMAQLLIPVRSADADPADALQPDTEQSRKSKKLEKQRKQAIAEDLENRLIATLTEYGVGEERAVQIVQKDPAECELWVNAWPYQNQTGMGNPAAVLISFIEKKRRPLPPGYKKVQEAELKRESRTRGKRSCGPMIFIRNISLRIICWRFAGNSAPLRNASRRRTRLFNYG